MNKDRMDISVVIPLFNKKDSVLRAINSILAQTYLPNEIIIVNDGSTDGSEKVVEQLNHPLIRLIHQENAGVSAARNKGVELAKGEWIAFLDADDLWLTEYLEEIDKIRVQVGNASVLATAYLLQSSMEEKSITLNNLPFASEIGELTNYFEVASTSNPPICSSAVVIKKSALETINGFPLDVHSGEDLITWARLASQYPIGYSRKPLSIFRLDDAHIYKNKPKRIPASPDLVFERLVKIYEKHKSLIGIKAYLAHWKTMRANIYIRLGENGKALKELKKALIYKPFKLKIYVFFLIALLPVKNKNRIFSFFSK